MTAPNIVNNIFSVTSSNFDQLALEAFRYQYDQNTIYKQWVDCLGVDPTSVLSIQQVPFLPISFFKTAEVVSGTFTPQVNFESSGTTQTTQSKHLVKDAELYRQSFTKGFNGFYGDVRNWCVIGLLPSYLERSGSSLIMMVDELVKMSSHPGSGFYLYDFASLHQLLQQLEAHQQPTLLIGVTFALLDFAEQYPMQLKHTTIMETGGMKGRREELVREEVHALLQQAFGVPAIHSEYGMTELLSQAYSKGKGIFYSVPWMKMLVREEDDPLKISTLGRGVLNIIDLANIHSCCFIATDDAGKINANGSFEVLGRTDNSDIRGCSLMSL